MEDKNALDAQSLAQSHGLAQSLPPSSILRGLPTDGRFYATHPEGSSSFGSWGYLQLIGGDDKSQDLAALRLCTYPERRLRENPPTGIYLVEVLARLERRPVPADASSPIQAAIRLGEAMDESDKEGISTSLARPEFELLVLTKGRVAVSRHAPEPAHASSFAEFSLVRVTCGRFEMVLPFAPDERGPLDSSLARADLMVPPPDEVMSVLGWGVGLRPVSSTAHVLHTPPRWDPPLMERLKMRMRSFSDAS